MPLRQPPRTPLPWFHRYWQPCRHARHATRPARRRPCNWLVPCHSPPTERPPHLMRIGPLPSLEIVLGHMRTLLLFRITLPGLVRLLEGILIGPLPRVVFGRFLAHACTSS